MNLEQALSLLDGDDEYAGALTTREEYRAAAFVLADEVRKLRAAQQQLAPLSEAAEMIETLVPDSETGECQVCGAAAITRGRAHRDDCKAQQLVERLRGAANKTCAHPWERVGISGDGHPFCSQCRTNLVKDPPWPAANPTKPPHEREPPHCPTCDCGAANQSPVKNTDR